LVHAGLGYTFAGSWNDTHIFQGWKIDLVEPVRRTALGFDYMDQLLDIIVSADRSTWYRKDEDEVQKAQARGIFTAEQVSDLYRRGERALQMILKNEPPFDRGWETWRPDPAWLETFDLPGGWEQV
jgi:predicted RNA-binding protein associated with RNAse of E/G family